MSDVRKGRQIPTNEVILPYVNSHGKEAIDLYEKSGRIAQEWQQLLINDILAYNDEGLWIHTKFGYSVPRRNGKNEVVAIREIYGLFNGEAMLHTAHRTATSSSAFKRLLKLITDSGLKEGDDFKVARQYGLEQIILFETNGSISFRTRTDTGGLGEGFDLLVIDEAQEYKDTQETTLKYVVSSSKNPQTIFCGTPNTPVSSGTVFSKFRKDVLSGNTNNSAWAEWSVDQLSAVNDVELWYQTNPSLGTILTERIIQDEIGTDDLDFNIQRLGYWTKSNLKSFISKRQWEELKVDKLPKLEGKLYVGIKYGKDGTNVALTIAIRSDHGVFVETYSCKPQNKGNQWIYEFCNKADIEKMVVDCSQGQQEILNQAYKVKELKIKPIYPTVKEVLMASETFMNGLENKAICHMGQPSLTNSVSNCQKRLIGTNGGFGFKTIKESIDICIMESCVFAYWLCKTSKAKTQTKFNY